MKHNQIDELINIFKLFAPGIWPDVKPAAEGSSILDVLNFTGEYPAEKELGKLKDYTDALKVCLTFVDVGMISRQAIEHGSYLKRTIFRVDVVITTYNEGDLCNYIGEQLLDFCDKNGGIISQRATTWEFESIMSSGSSKGADDLFHTRVYAITLSEIS